MKTISREINPYVDPVSREDLKVGKAYFEARFTSHNSFALPIFNTFVLIDITNEEDLTYYTFIQKGLEYTHEHEVEITLTYGALQCFYNFEEALDILLHFSLVKDSVGFKDSSILNYKD